MRSPRETLDPTAGERARETREHPDALVIQDPTDPRYGQPLPETAVDDEAIEAEHEPEDPMAA